MRGNERVCTGPRRGGREGGGHKVRRRTAADGGGIAWQEREREAVGEEDENDMIEER